MSVENINLPYGKERRKIIRQYFEKDPDAQIAVNRKWQAQIKQDPDLQKLLKKGLVRLIRDGIGRCRQSYLVKKHEQTCPSTGQTSHGSQLR